MSTPLECRTITGEELRNCDTLFSREIDQDPWVHYHATSSTNEGSIDLDGLNWSAAVCSAAEVLDLAVVYRSMNWCGRHTGGFVVLDSFSLTGDFQGRESKPIYFREYSLRPLLYARRDFAGGESARAVRYALRDLDEYLTDASVQAEHYDRQRQEALNCVLAGALPPRVVRVNLKWLRQKVERFAQLRQRCEACENSHEYGVVYAVKFMPQDIPSLNYSDSMGLRCFMALPRKRLVAKVRVHADDAPSVMGNDGDLFWNNRWRYESTEGLLAELAEAEQLGRAYSIPEPEAMFRHQDKQLLDPAAGIDESEEIAGTYGSPAFAEHLRRFRDG